MAVKSGFLVFENATNGADIAWVTPHSGPALETPTSRDENSDTVASLCWMKVGGKLIISTMPRKRALGIDFNRGRPPLRKSLDHFALFQKNTCPEKLQEYREKYAWCASSKREHNRKLRIYKHFWDEVKKSGRNVVFIHRKFTRLKNFPSLMDIVAYEGYGFSRKILARVIGRINSKYAGFFQSVSDNYCNAILLEEKRALDRIMEIYGSINLSKIGIEYKKHLLNDLKIIHKYGDKKRIKRLDKHFTTKNFILAVKSALQNGGKPKITVESIFKGEKGRGHLNAIFRQKNVISIESNAFINYWYPSEASNIILDIVNEVKPMRKITNFLRDIEADESS